MFIYMSIYIVLNNQFVSYFYLLQDDIDRDKSGRPLPNGPRNSGAIGVGGGISGGGVGSSGDMRNNSRMPVSDDYQWDNTYGLSSQFLESLNIRGPLINRIFVANVIFKYF